MKSKWCSTAAFLSSTRHSAFFRGPNDSMRRRPIMSFNEYPFLSSVQYFSHSILPRTFGQMIRSHMTANTEYLTSHAHTDTINNNNNQPKLTQAQSQAQSQALACSRQGLDPLTNRFHAPIVYHENYSFPNWPTTHTFPMDKFARLAHALTTTCHKTHPNISTLSRPLVRSYLDFFRPLNFADVPYEWFAEPSGPLNATFLQRFLNGTLTTEEERWIGFREHTSRPELIERTVLEVAGTVLTTQLAMKYGIASNAAGGTHHASHDRGAGYTILNDLAIAANFLTDENLDGQRRSQSLCVQGQGVETVLVVDADVHQGDGTAKFDKLKKENRLVTLSIHCQDNYPTPKANSTYDIGLPAGCRDDEYMEAFMEAVDKAIDQTQPDIVLYDAGVDVFIGDKLGKLKVTENGIRKRDRWLIERCVKGDIPVAAVIGGGYDKDVDTLARRHAIIHEECAFVWRKYRMWERCTPNGHDMI